jgi:energy-coupling factor transporter ATP-binding protein EcfA2
MATPSAPERPIESSDQDKLERSRFIDRLSSSLVNADTKRSTGVVVGITGSWGSGKSSLLNLLKEHLERQYSDALVVRFDPWLVSGRNDLIAEFLGELIGTINADEKRRAKFKKLGATFAQYGAQLAPLGNLWAPGLGAVFSGSFRAAERALSNKESLSTLRSRLIKELREISAPIVVLIDELDRIEDEEIRTVAQLVRSVLDFPAISYVLAFDPERVMQALGSGVSENDRMDRGRSYLEKIVQLQIPIPVTFSEEIIRLLNAELTALQKELRLPEKFEKAERYVKLLELLAADAIHTPRDVRRLVGTFHVLAGMLYGEVDWIDLLAYSALLIKSPSTVAKMRRNPEDFLDDLMSKRSFVRMAIDDDNKSTVAQRLKDIVPSAELNDCTKGLLEFLFPSLSEAQQGVADHVDAFHRRRPLLSVLRLGLLPGAYSREEIKSLFESEPETIKFRLRDAYAKGVIDPLTDRIDDLYSELPPNRYMSFWRGVAAFAAKPDCQWMVAYSPMHEKIYNFANILEQAVRRDKKYAAVAVKIFSQLRSDGESELIACWLRSHLFAFMLYGNKQQSSDKAFLNLDQTEALARELTGRWRSEHLSGKLLPCRWDLQPAYSMADMGVWDEPCRGALDESLADNRALDGFTLLLYGGVYTVSRETVGKLCTLEKYLERANSRLNSGAELHETVRVALQKAVGRGAYG